MTVDVQWHAAELAGILTTYIEGIEDVLKEPMMGAVAYLDSQIQEIYDGIAPSVEAAIAATDINLPWE